MWDRKKVKALGKIAFKANYWRSVLSAVLITLIAGGSALANGSRSANQSVDQDPGQPVQDAQNVFHSMSEEDKSALFIVLGILAVIGLVLFILYTALKIFVFNPLQVGCYRFFRENAVTTETDLGTLKAGFSDYKRVVLTMFMRDLFTALWFCLFIIPGCVKIYSYRMVPYILKDNPELSWKETITASRHMMNGQKWNVFVFDLSYIGWYLLGAITLGLVNVFWTQPYWQNANAYIYLALSGEAAGETFNTPDASYAAFAPEASAGLTEPEAPALHAGDDPLE